MKSKAPCFKNGRRLYGLLVTTPTKALNQSKSPRLKQRAIFGGILPA